MSPNILEKILYKIRNTMWVYPDILFFGENSAAGLFTNFYKLLRPLSHILTSFIVLFLITFLISSNINFLVRADTDTLIEGVLVGVDDAGNLNTIQKVNPLVVTSIQIEKDLSELIYDSLVKINVKGEVENILAEAIARTEDGSNYRVKLREDVYWHDGERFTVKDVKATFDLLEKLDANSSTSTIYSRASNNRIKIVEIPGDDFRFEFQLDGFVPNFFELISFKILPAKYLEEVNTFNVLTNEPFINSNPTGTGPYKLDEAGKDYIQLVKNDNYYNQNKIPQIKNIKFQFYSELDTILDALNTGQVHSIAGLSSRELSKLKASNIVSIYRTGTIHTQYYGIYFNLSDSGPAFFKDKKVRQAISSAINRDFLIKILEGDAEEAVGPIPKESFAYSADVNRYVHNPEQARLLLDSAGWKIENDGQYRVKDGQLLEFKIIALDNIDRNKVSDSIVEDLADIGVKIEIIKKPYLELVNQHVLTRNYPALIFGVSTFVDPDRYEFFHSTQIQHPGLNLSSYISAEKTVRIVDGKSRTLPEVDVRLNEGRSSEGREDRITAYREFQRIIGEEVPVVFLYHPILNYTVNKRVKGIDIGKVESLEDRFEGISSWYIEF